MEQEKDEGAAQRAEPERSEPERLGGACRAQTRLMAQEKGEGPVRYKGLADALLKIPREEGLRALWKGLLPRLMRIPPGQARPTSLSSAVKHIITNCRVRAG